MLSTCREPLATFSPCIATSEAQDGCTLIQERVGRHHRRDRRSRRAASPEPSAMPLSIGSQTEARVQGLNERQHGAAAVLRIGSLGSSPAHAHAMNDDAARRGARP